MTEHLDPSALDAPRPEPTAPPATHIHVDTLPADALARIEHMLSAEERDAIAKAQIAGREAKRAAAAKDKAEHEASSKRAEETVKEVIERGEQETPPVEGYQLEVPEVSEG